VIIDIGEPKAGIADDMNDISRATGIPVIHITADMRGTAEAFRTLGSLLFREGKGLALAHFCQKTLAAADAVMQRAGEAKKTALFCVGPLGTNVMAKGSFHSEIFDWMTGNLAIVANPSSRATGNETSMEQILFWDPEVIIFGPESVYSGTGNDHLWQLTRAFQSGQYFRVPQGPYNWMGAPPSINRYLGILWLAKQLYPQFANYDLYTECAEYYNLFYGYTLSRARFDQLTGQR
jgi:iron complex transport system substrate-binding protein